MLYGVNVLHLPKIESSYSGLYTCAAVNHQTEDSPPVFVKQVCYIYQLLKIHSPRLNDIVDKQMCIPFIETEATKMYHLIWCLNVREQPQLFAYCLIIKNINKT
jgi:hypothetical protein